MLLADVNDTYTDLVTIVFSSTIAAKAWLATVAVILAVVQVLTGARLFGKFRFVPLRGPKLARVHRWSGRTAFVFTVERVRASSAAASTRARSHRPSSRARGSCRPRS